MATDDSILQKFPLLLATVGTAAIVVKIYHFITVCFCNRRHSADANQNHPQRIRRSRFVSETMETSIATPSASMAQLIPARKSQKSVDSMGEDSPCAVCLSEFEEGKELRTMPGNMHSFHAPCIDMWLYSHSTCPICRSDATPNFPLPFQREPSSSSDVESEANDSGTLQDIVIDSTSRA